MSTDWGKGTHVVCRCRDVKGGMFVEVRVHGFGLNGKMALISESYRMDRDGKGAVFYWFPVDKLDDFFEVVDFIGPVSLSPRPS